MKSIDIKSLLIGVLISFFGGFLPFVAANNYLSVGRYELHTYTVEKTYSGEQIQLAEVTGRRLAKTKTISELLDTKTGAVYRQDRENDNYKWKLDVSSPTD